MAHRIQRRPSTDAESERVGWRAEPASAVDRRRRTEDGAPYDVCGKFPHRNYVVRYPEEGASRTPPPTVGARCRFQRSRKVGGRFGCGFPHLLHCMPQGGFRNRP